MEKQALLGSMIKGAVKAGSKFFNRSKGMSVGKRIGGTISAGATNAAKRAGYIGDLGGTIKRGPRGRVTGLTGRGKAVAGATGGLAVGSLLSGSSKNGNQ